MSTVNERRYGILQVSPEFLIEMSKHRDKSAKNFFVEENPLPDDARMVACDVANVQMNSLFDIKRGVVSILIESSTFQPVPLGEPIPYLLPPRFKYFLADPKPPAPDPLLKCPSCGAENGLKPFHEHLLCSECGWAKP